MSIEVDSSFNKTPQGLLHETWFFNVVPSVSWGWGDPTHNSSNIHGIIPLASCCLNKLKSNFPGLITTFCKQHSNWDGSSAIFLDLIQTALLIWLSITLKFWNNICINWCSRCWQIMKKLLASSFLILVKERVVRYKIW